MKRNIMLLFLSDVKVDRSNGLVRKTTFIDVGESATTNESAVRKLIKDLGQGSLERLFVIATDKVLREILPGYGMSHLDFFYQRLQDVLPNIAEITEIVPYRAEASMQDALHNVLVVSEHLRRYIGNQAQRDQIVIHADTTGGMRHANMMILDIIRLLEYSGVEIGHIYYSLYGEHRVDEVNVIYDLFNMTSGAEEFVNFGSVQALDKYFPIDRRTPVVDNLLKAMSDFAEEVKLCHHGRFSLSIDKLRQALEEFQTYSKHNDVSSMGNEELLMAQFVSRIHREYASLLSKGTDIVDEIKWCLEHDYIQQALTLYVEGIPDWLFTKEIVAFTTLGRKIVSKSLKEKGTGNLHFYALTQFVPAHIDAKQCDEIRGLKDRLLAKNSWQEKAVRMKRQEVGKKFRQLLNSTTEAEARQRMEEIEKEIQDGQNDSSLMIKFVPECKEKMLKWCSWIKNPSIVKNMGGAGEEDALYSQMVTAVARKNLPDWDTLEFHRLFGRQKLQKLSRALTNKVTMDELLDMFITIEYNYAYRFMNYINEELFVINISLLDFKDILNDYGKIKNERNISNHARNEADMLSASEIKQLLATCLVKLKCAV